MLLQIFTSAELKQKIISRFLYIFSFSFILNYNFSLPFSCVVLKHNIKNFSRERFNLPLTMKRILYHYPLSPFSRKVRIMMREKGLDYELKVENFWERRRKFLAMNPSCQVPVLFECEENISSEDIEKIKLNTGNLDKNIRIYADSNAICEYLDEKYNHTSLLGKDIEGRAEVRRLTSWFNNKFYYEVTKLILDERVFKFLKKQGSPNSNYIRAAKSNLKDHMEYIDYLLQYNKNLTGEEFTLADICAAAQISVLDYLGYISFENTQYLKEWYMIIKSKPSFRGLLEDTVNGFEPSKHYKLLDF